MVFKKWIPCLPTRWEVSESEFYYYYFDEILDQARDDKFSIKTNGNYVVLSRACGISI